MPSNITTRLAMRPLAAALAALSTAAAAHAQTDPPPPTIIYADASALPGGSGSDWLHAFRDLQDALAAVPTTAAAIGDHYEIHIAQGIYRPDRATLNRNASFLVNSGVALIGGYGGLLSPNPDIQDPSTFVTVLSGDLRADDGPNFANTSDNSYHVVQIQGDARNPWTTAEAYLPQLQALTISGGNADGSGTNGSGAGVLAGSVHASLDSCIIRNNRASNTAGVDLQNAQSSNVLNTTISDNVSANSVGGLELGYSHAGVWGCTIVRNRSTVAVGGLEGWTVDISGTTIADNVGGDGGGAALWVRGTIQTSIIAGNVSSSEGGGLLLGGAGNFTILSSLIAHNTAPSGAGISAAPANVEIANCTLVRNTATGNGGALFASSTQSMRIWNSILWANTAAHGPSVYVASGSIAIDHSIAQTGTVGASLGPAISTADPRFVNPTGISSAPTSWSDKDYRIGPGSPAIDSGSEPTAALRNLYTDASTYPRLVNSTCAAYARIDLGAYEFQGFACPPIIPITYVRADAPLGGDGHSWAAAYRDIQDALATPGVTSIWIAQGVYHPDRGTFDTSARYRIEKPYVELHGGFAGTETALSQRTIAAHPTILSADLLGNDSSSPVSRLDNASALVQISLPNPYTTAPNFTLSISGLTFQGAASVDPAHPDDRALSLAGGYSGPDFQLSDCAFLDNHTDPSTTYNGQDAGGGALRAFGQSLTLTRCRFVGNTCSTQGGALYTSTRLTATDCDFIVNQSAGGGAISAYQYGPSVVLRRCSFIANAAIGQGGVSGGAVSLGPASTIDSCRFIGNTAFAYSSTTGADASALGGAIDLRGIGNPAIIANSLLAGNRCAGPGASGAALRAQGDIRLINCTVANNAAAPTLGAPATAPAIHANTGQASNCIFWNSPAYGPGTNSGVASTWASSLLIFNCLGLNDGLPSDPRFTNPAGPDGIIGTSDDDYSLAPNSPAIDAADSSRLPSGITTDLAGNARFIDAFGIPNTGTGTPNYLDIGAYEFTGPHTCLADFNNSGTLSTQDIFDFLNAWFAGNPRADINGNGLSSTDILDFITAWFAGC